MPDCTLNYRILEKTENGHTSYGIEVSKQCLGRSEKSVVMDITSSRQEIEELYEKVRSGSVTPVTLLDVASDFVTEKSLT